MSTHVHYSEAMTQSIEAEIYRFHVHTAAGSYYTNNQYDQMTDGELASRGVVSIDCWSNAIEDYVEVRRVP